MKKLLTALLCSLSLSACNLSSLEEAQDNLKQLQKTKQQLTELYVYVKELKDSLQYAEFWITIHQLEASDQNGELHLLFDDPDGKTINLISRDGLAELLALGKLPEGDYDSFALVLGRDVHIVTPDQQEINTHFPTDEATFRIEIDGQLSVSKEQIVNFIVNFDAEQFVVNAEKELEPYKDEIEALIEEAKESDLYQQITTELEGTIVEIKGSTFWIETASGVRVKVVVPGFASIYNEHRRKNDLNLNALKHGQLVRIFGKLIHKGDKVVLEALCLALELIDEHIDDYDGRPTLAKVEGEIVSLDLETGTLELDLEESSFLPHSDTIEVIDLHNAMFTRGQLDMLQPGMEIDIKGYWDGSVLDAEFVKLDVAPDSHELERSGGDHQLTEIEGTVVSIEGSIATISVTPSEDNTSSEPVEIQVELNQAWFKNGDISCLESGVELELHGLPAASDGDLFVVSSVELENSPCNVGNSQEEDTTTDTEESDDVNGDIEETGGEPGVSENHIPEDTSPPAAEPMHV